MKGERREGLFAWATCTLVAFTMVGSSVRRWSWAAFFDALSASLLPGIVVFLLTFGVLWVIDGFRHTK
jgi:hypothetical protein